MGRKCIEFNFIIKMLGFSKELSIFLTYFITRAVKLKVLQIIMRGASEKHQCDGTKIVATKPVSIFLTSFSPTAAVAKLI